MDYFSDLAGMTSATEPQRVEARMPGWRFSGNINLATPVWEIPALVEATKVLGLFKLPKGATVLPYIGGVATDGDPGTLLFTIGDDDGTTPDPDRYSASLTVTDGALVPFEFNADGWAPLYTLQKDSWITATVGAAPVATEGVKVQFALAWLVG